MFYVLCNIYIACYSVIRWHCLYHCYSSYLLNQTNSSLSVLWEGNKSLPWTSGPGLDLIIKNKIEKCQIFKLSEKWVRLWGSWLPLCNNFGGFICLHQLSIIFSCIMHLENLRLVKKKARCWRGVFFYKSYQPWFHLNLI